MKFARKISFVIIGITMTLAGIASANPISWTSPDTGLTWSAYESSEKSSLLEMKKKCLDKGLVLPDTESAKVEKDFFHFISDSLGPDVEGFPHFTFRSVEVRFFPLINRARKQDRYESSQKFDAELVDYFSSVYDLCMATHGSNCQKSLDSMDRISLNMAKRTEYYRQIGFLQTFVDALGHDANLEELEQEYSNYRVEKDSYETARTLIVSREEQIN